MITMMQRWLSLAGIVGCFLAGMLNAADYTQSNPASPSSSSSSRLEECPPPPCPPKPCPPCDLKPWCPRTPAYGYQVPCNFAILWDAGPKVCEGIDLFVTADFLWWTAREDGLAYATKGVNNTDTANGGHGSLKHPDFDWAPGFKVGAGANLWHDGWDIYAQYTWLHAEGSKTTSTNPAINAALVQANTNSLYPTWHVGGTPGTSGTNVNFFSPINDPLTKATGRWDLHFNVIDVELGRNYFVGRHLTLRPFLGLKATWQHQDYKIRYFRLSLATPPPPITSGTLTMNRMRQDHDMWGIGVRFGMNTAWHFTRQWSIFGDWALAALHTKFDIDRKDRLELYNTDESGNILNRPRALTSYNANNTFYTLKGVLEAAIGLRLDVWLGCNDAYHLRLQAAWEEQLWWGQNNMIGRIEECAHGDLMLHGLTIKARFDF